MSIRIYELSKQTGRDNKELIALLRERGYSVSSASSSIDNISAQALVEELGAASASESPPAAEPAEAAPAQVEPPAAESPAAAAQAAPTPAAPPAVSRPAGPPSPRPLQPPTGPASVSSGPPVSAAQAPGSQSSLPAGVFVKSAAQVAQEKVEAKAAARPQPAPSAAPVSTPPPAPISRQAQTPPAVSRPPVSAPPPVSRPPSVGSAPPAISPRPMGPPPARPPSAPTGNPATMSPPSGPGRSAPVLSPPSGEKTEGSAPSADAPAGDVKVLQVKPPIVVRDFALALGVKPFKLISELMEMGIFASMNLSIEENVASRLAEAHGFLLDIRHRGDQQQQQQQAKKEKKVVVEVDESTLMEPRPPVVCILGHVDHGKTTLLDKIRAANVAGGEAGGITQHIGAYQVLKNDRKITFLDTPGHAAFNKMRARGANVTDVAILVVAADDGFMPQTDEALSHIRAANVTPIVAINKIDARGANLDRVKQQMQERDLMPEDWGGETITVPVSALKGDGIDHLLEMILLQAEVLELKANPKAEASGIVIEAQLEVGRGPTATVIVQRGTLRVGDALVCGPHWTKVKALINDQGENVKQAAPATPVRVIGWSGTPESGASFKAVKNDREAKRIAEETEQELRQAALGGSTTKSVSIEHLFEAIASQARKSLRVVIKADVYGSVEALQSVLGQIKSDKVSLEIVAADVGLVTKNDVLMASAAKAAIIGFNTRNEPGVDAAAKHHGVVISHHKIIYELVDQVRDQMADLLDPDIRETKVGAAEVRQVFPVAKGFVAGCLVVEGRVIHLSMARVRRGGRIEFDGKLSTLRRLKDEVKEVRAGTECGMRLEGYDGYQPGDVIECYEIQKLRASL
jgi:translation initiation factor IF-2